MPRRTRMYLPGLPYHVVQRGNNRDTSSIVQEKGANPLNCISVMDVYTFQCQYTSRFVCALTS